MINPTVGRAVWYWSDVKQQAQPFAATVAYVHDDRMVNLSVVDANGIQFAKQSVVLVQDGDVRPEREFCEWMPYQKSVAKGEIASPAPKGGESNAVLVELPAASHPIRPSGYEGGPVRNPPIIVAESPATSAGYGVSGDPDKPTS